MEIKLRGNYLLKSDTTQFVLNKMGGKDKNDKPTVLGSWYYSSLEGALRGYTKKQLLQSEATTIKELLQEHKELKEYIKEVCDGA